MPNANPLKQIVVKQKNGQPVGIYSCCSANDYVIEAALEAAKRDDSCVLIEATANQEMCIRDRSCLTPKSSLCSHTNPTAALCAVCLLYTSRCV